jgi:hypothetical protein
VKVFAVFVLVLSAGLVPAEADTTQTQTWDVTASCIPNSVLGIPCFAPGDINATFTTQLATGTFVDAGNGCFCQFTGTVEVITAISGTLDGEAMSLVPFAGGDWLLDGFPEGEVLFDAGGIEYRINFDQGVRLTTTNDFEFLRWSAVEVPEPAIFWMLFTPLLLLGLSRWAQMSLRKLPGR